MLAAAIWLLPTPAMAQFAIRTAVTSQFQYNSNVFDLQNGFPVLNPDGTPAVGPNEFRHADTFYAYSGLADLNYQWDQQLFYIDAKDTQYDYQHFLQLTHNEYNVDGGWNWKLGPLLDGSLDVARIRTLVAFTDVVSSEISFQTEQREAGSIRLQLTPDWRLEGTGFYHTIDEPLPGTPDLVLYEDSATAAIKYLARAGLTAGLSVNYLTGHFTGAPQTLDPAYQQTTEDLVATYKATGASTFAGEAGYSRRTSDNGLDNLSGPTGALDYRNQLTAKTAVEFKVDRAITSFIATTGAQIETDASVTTEWKATYKIHVLGTYTWSYIDMPGQGNTPAQTRIDHLQFATLTINYDARRWLTVKPYATFQTRSSNLVGANFNATTIGVYLTVNWQEGKVVSHLQP